jgi:hypothetical protein
MSVKWCLLTLFFLCPLASAEDTRAQYPRLLQNSYFGIHAGSIRYRFTGDQLQVGLHTESVQVPHLGVRALLIGHQFNKFLSAQVSEMRPVEWVKYRNINGDGIDHSVWMNVAGLTLKPQVAVSSRTTVFGEAGLAIVTRKGFSLGGSSAVADFNGRALLTGGGISFGLSDHWSLVSEIVSASGNSEHRQPRTTFLSGGLNYTMRPLPPEILKKNSDSGFLYPENIIQIGYSSSAMGFGTNDFLSRGRVPVFWAGDVNVARGISVNYQRNTFHTRRTFSLDWGAGLSAWRSERNGDPFVTASLYPVLEFTLIRARPMDLYFRYSLAGPTYISKSVIDAMNTGRHFTFQDFMGIGIFAGPKRRVNSEVRIVHYSNGNIFTHNPGITVPLNLNVGYTF